MSGNMNEVQVLVKCATRINTSLTMIVLYVVNSICSFPIFHFHSVVYTIDEKGTHTHNEFSDSSVMRIICTFVITSRILIIERTK